MTKMTQFVTFSLSEKFLPSRVEHRTRKVVAHKFRLFLWVRVVPVWCSISTCTGQTRRYTARQSPGGRTSDSPCTLCILHLAHRQAVLNFALFKINVFEESQAQMDFNHLFDAVNEHWVLVKTCSDLVQNFQISD